MKSIVLVIESVSDNECWGRVEFDDNLIVDSATSVEKLQIKMKKLLKDFHELVPVEIEFDLQYDIAGMFDEKKYLNTSAVAEEAGINKSLMRQYASGLKHPSYERALHIESVIHKIGKDLLSVRIARRPGIRKRS